MRRSEGVWYAAVASTVVVLLQSLRAAFPLLRDLAETADPRQAALVGVGALGATAGFAVFGRWVRTRTYFLFWGLAAAGLFGSQVVLESPMLAPLLAASAACVAVLGGLLMLPNAPRGGAAAAALVLGGIADAAIKLGLSTWDPIWQDGPLPMVLALLAPVVLMGAAILLFRHPIQATAREDSVPGFALVAVGAWFTVLLISVGNAATVAAGSGLPLPVASAVVLVGWILLAWTVRERSSAAMRWVAAILLAISAALLPVSEGFATVLFALIGMAATGPLLAASLTGRPAPRPVEDSEAGESAQEVASDRAEPQDAEDLSEATDDDPSSTNPAQADDPTPEDLEAFETAAQAAVGSTAATYSSHAVPAPAAASAPRPATGVFGLGVGLLLFAIVQVLYLAHHTVGLPLGNAWLLVLPALALLAAASGAERRPAWDPAPHALPLIPAVGLVIPVALWFTEPVVAEESQPSIALVNYNINEGLSNNAEEAPPSALNLEAIAATIENTTPNTVTLQEVGRGWATSGYSDIAGWLQRRLGMNLSWGPAADRGFGNAVYSTMPMVEQQVVELGRRDGSMARSAVGAAVEADFGRTWVFSLHLAQQVTPSDSAEDGDDEDSAEQVDTPTGPTEPEPITVLLRALPQAQRTVIAGDFNAGRESAVIEAVKREGFRDGLAGVGAAVQGELPERTFQGPTPRGPRVPRTADYIFLSGDLAFEEYGVGSSQASDHRPLYATVVAR